MRIRAPPERINMKKIIGKIAWIITAISMLTALLAVSTSDFYVMELDQIVPAYIETLELGAMVTMAAGIIVALLSER